MTFPARWNCRLLAAYAFFTLLAVSPLGSLDAADRPNILLICVDDLRPELNCFGVDHMRSPHIDQLAEAGTRFERHYVQAPTCGASRYTLLTGRYGGASNNALFQRASRMQEAESVHPSMPAWFRQHGYVTVSVGKVSHHPGGRGGPDWDDEAIPEMPNSWDRHLLHSGPWQHPRGWMHGLAHGEIRKSAKDMDVFQALEGTDDIYPDGGSTAQALQQIDRLAQEEAPFLFAFGILRPHLPFGSPKNYLTPYLSIDFPPIANPQKPLGRTTWHASGEFMKYNRWNRDPNTDPEFALQVRQHYAACVSYADAQVGKVIARLKERSLWQNTIVILWGDHGWHLGEHAIWGKHSLFERSLRSPLIVRAPKSSHPVKASEDIVETVDVFPTLCDLSGIPTPAFAQGESLTALIEGQSTKRAKNVAVSYFRNAQTIRDARFRMIEHKDGYIELYDHQLDPHETNNVADQHPDSIVELREQLAARVEE